MALFINMARVLLLLILLAPPFLNEQAKNFAVADYKLVETLCHNSETPETCMKCALSSEGVLKADGVGVTRMIVNCLKHEANTLSQNFTKLGSTADGELKNIYNRCAKEYGFHIAKKEFVAIQRLLKHRNWDNAEDAVVRALRVHLRCHSDLEKYQDKVPSDVSERMKVFEELNEATCRIIERF